MNNQFLVPPSLHRSLSTSVYVSLGIVGLISILDIIGWIFDLEILKGFSQIWFPMMPATAICFILSTVALVFIVHKPLNKSLSILSLIFGLIISFVGLVLILHFAGFLDSPENISGLQLMFYNFLIKPDFHMALLTAITFFFTGIIITLLSYKSRQTLNIAHFLVIFPFSLGYLVIMSYILGVSILHEIQSVQVALNTGIAFLFLSTALLFINPESWLMRSFTSNFAGSMMARKLLPSLMLLPLIIAWLRIYGEEAGFFPSEVGVVLVAMTYTLLYIFLVWLTARSVNIKDRARAKSENDLQASKDWYATTLSSIGDAVIGTNIEGKITFLNKIAEQLTGWSLDEALDRPVKEVFHIINEVTRLEVENPVDQVLMKGTIVGLANHTLLVRKDGVEVPIDDSGAPIISPSGGISGVVLVFRDITERKKNEKSIFESEQRLRFHFENSPLAVVEWDADYIVTQWSVEAERLFGWTHEETLGKNIGSLNMIVEEDFPIVENTMKRLSSGQERTVVSTNRNYTKQGTIIECTWFNSVLFNEQGEMGSVMSLVLDITEMKATEKKILESQERFRSVLDNSLDVIYRLNLQTGKFEYISPSAETVFGRPFDELVNMDARASLSIIHPDDLPYIQSVLAKMETTGAGNMDYRIRTKNGDYRWISNHMSLIRDNSGRPIYRDGNVRDITAIRQAKEETLAANAELTLFNKAMVGRELRMIELKKEVNELCSNANLPPVYIIESEKDKS